MAELARPNTRVHASFLAAMAEFQAEGRGGIDDNTMIGAEIREYGGRWALPGPFGQYLRWLREQSLEESPRPEGFVPSTTLWWVEGGEYLGRVAIRHRLTPRLRQAGGHIGYDVRPSARRRGHATAMLAAALPVAHALGIGEALLTCYATNVGSQKVIQANGGVYDGRAGDLLYYWVPTAPVARGG